MTINHELERMKAIVGQVAAELKTKGISGTEAEAQLMVYGTTVGVEQARTLFEQASKDTAVNGITLEVRQGAQRYICWNCCGLRFEGEDGMCPNCGESALELPDEVAFGVRFIKTRE